MPSRKRKPTMLFLVAALTLGACAPRVALRGNLPLPEKLAQVAPGKQNRDQVAELLGSPSTLGTFDDKVWYYISRKTEQFAFFDEKVVDEQVVAIYFDDKNIVQAVYHYDKDDLREITMVERSTPTAGRELSVLEQLLGNIGRFGTTTQ